MIDEKDLQIAVDHAVAGLKRAVRNLRKFSGSSATLPPSVVDSPIVRLAQASVQNCRVFCDRETMLREFGFPKNGNACEIGTSTGIFARLILDTLKPTTMHICDIDFSRFDNRLRERPGVQIHEGDSVKAIKSFADASLDFAYIDADHAYKSIKREIAAIRTKVKPGGYIAFNDYTRWSVTEVQPYGVVAAVNEAIRDEKWQMVAVALSGTGHFDVAVRVPPK
jgi:predicted O-methyltransferase YrrM